MQRIVGLVSSGPSSTRHDDDFADRLSSRYTVLFLVVFTVIVSSHLYIGKPITCWPPAEFKGSWVKYVNNYCWVKNTYYVSFDEDVPDFKFGEREQRELRYYPWLPFILIVQALGFYIPSIVWHSFNQKAGVDCDDILAATKKYQCTREEKGRRKLIGMISNQMDRFLRSRPATDPASDMKLRSIWRMLCCYACLARGRYLIVLYLFSKILYMVNIIGQFMFLNRVLYPTFSLFGYEMLQKMLHPESSAMDSIFPLVTFCDFHVRRVGNIHRYSVMCVLPINMYASKVYAFLWVWMLMVGCISGVSFVQWVARCMCGRDKYRYVQKHLSYVRAFSKPTASPSRQAHAVAEFVDLYLRQDGVFVLRLIGHNTNNMTVSDVLSVLWDNWTIHEKKRLDNNLGRE